MATDNNSEQNYTLSIDSDAIENGIELMENLSDVIDECEEDVSKLSSKMSLLSGEIVEMSAWAGIASNDIEGLSSNVSSLNDNTKKTSRSIGNFSKKITKLPDEFTAVSDSFIDLTFKSLVLSNNMYNLSTDTAMLTTDLYNVCANVDYLATDLSVLTSNFEKCSVGINDAQTDLSALKDAEKPIEDISKSTEEMNDKLEDTGAGAEKAGSKLSKLIKSAVSLENIKKVMESMKKGMDAVDQYINTGNKLSTINDELENQMSLQNKVNAAATRSSLSYTDMADAVSGIGGLDTFKENDQAIAFTELMQKTLKVNSSDKSISDVTGSLSDGVLKGDEFSSLATSAPMIEKALSAYTGKSGEELKKLADQGGVTANLLKNAMFAASGDINEEYEKQPKTFADIWTKIKNSAMNAMNPLMDLVSRIINSPGIQGAINFIISGFGFVYNAINAVVGFMEDNWPIIRTILLAVGALLAFLGAQAFINFMIAKVASLSALWPLLLIIGVIAAVIGVLQYLGVSFEDIFGFIGGVVGAAIAGVWNLFFGLFELILGIVNFLVNPFINFANFFGNLFTNPISSIIYLFQGMADSVLGIIESVASALDLVFGSKMADAVSGWRTGLKDMADAAVEKYAPEEDYQNIVDNINFSTEDLGISRMDYSDSFDKGKETGKELYGELDNLLTSMSKGDPGFDISKFNTEDDKGTYVDPVIIEGEVNMQDEDLSYLRKMAERDYIANIATNTLAPNISVSFGDVHETADVNQLFSRIQTILKEQIAVSPEGVY
jgi:tape measure domain-containing protein